MIALTIFLFRKDQIGKILLISFGVIAAVVLLILATGSKSLALMFPWRLSVATVPICFSLLLGWIAVNYVDDEKGRWLNFTNLLFALTILFLFSTYTNLTRYFGYLDNNSHYLKEHIVLNTPPDSVFVIPSDFSDFRMDATRAVFVDFKSHPYEPAKLVEWRKRMELLEEFENSPESRCELLTRISNYRSWQYLIADTNKIAELNCEFLEKKITIVEDRRNWVVYQLEESHKGVEAIHNE